MANKKLMLCIYQLKLFHFCCNNRLVRQETKELKEKRYVFTALLKVLCIFSHNSENTAS